MLWSLNKKNRKRGKLRMTNIEYMRQKIVETVMGLDEMELLQVADDTEMSLKETEGVFNCLICEKEYGECGSSPCTNKHCSRFLDWCVKEHVS